MLTSSIPFISTISALVSSASVPQSSLAFGNLPPSPPASRVLTLPSARSNNFTLSAKKLKIDCDSNRWGRDLKVKSCRDLFGYLKKDDEELIFSNRDSGLPHDIPLPIRTLSSMSQTCTNEDMEGIG